MKSAPISQSAASAVQLNMASALLSEQKNQIAFLQSVIDKFITICEHQDGTPFITREEFNKDLSHPDAPKDYSYDDYINDSFQE
jgi:hypothetical protein